MYVRDVYDELYNRYVSQFRYVIVTGNPGIGKSYFSLYVLYRLRKERRDLVIVYESVPTSIRVVFNGDTVSIPVNEIEFSPLLEKEDTIYLFDAGTQGAGKPRLTTSRTIVFSSPSLSNYHDWYKERVYGDAGGGVMVYMPTWSWDEINKLCIVRKLESEKARERFNHWGGIARCIFRTVQKCDTSEYADLNTAISDCIPENIIRLANALRGGDVDKNSHMVLHICVTNRLPDGLLDYTSAVIHFASDYVVDRVFEKYIDSTKNRLIDVVNHCKDSWLSGIHGQLFERFAHFSFMNHDALEYDTKCLEPAHSMFNKVTKKKFGKLIETPLPNVAALASNRDQKGVYLKPVQKNFESLDAIIPPKVGVQMTVASSHPIKTVELQRVVNALGCTKTRTFTFYFVVPRDVFDGFKKQSYLDNSTQAQKDCSTNGQKDGSRKAKTRKSQKDDSMKAQKYKFSTDEVVEQWALCIDL